MKIFHRSSTISGKKFVNVLPNIKSQAFKEIFSFIFVFPIIINLPTNFLQREKVFSINFF